MSTVHIEGLSACLDFVMARSSGCYDELRVLLRARLVELGKQYPADTLFAHVLSDDHDHVGALPEFRLLPEIQLYYNIYLLEPDGKTAIEVIVFYLIRFNSHDVVDLSANILTLH